MKKPHQILRTILALSLCCVLFCSTAFAGSFPDVPDNATYAEAVEVLADMAVLQGDASGNFNPNKTITRAEAAAVMCRLVGVEDEVKNSQITAFTDVASSHWASGYVAKATELDIIGGYGNGKFGPSDAVTQQQIIKMLVCAWGYEDSAQAKGGWPNGYAAVAEELGVVSSSSSVSSAPATRATVAQWAYAMLFVFENVE